ncbi:MAG: pseudouridine synthase, partial [Pseudomonadota bacterium]
IEAGRVKVNGRRIDSPALNVTESDKIEVDGAAVGAPERARLWRYHKPTGLVTSARDEKGRATVFDKMPPELPRVMSVGRLDLNSEGLLLLTNDGDLKRRLELPSTGWTRRYRVRAHGRIDDAGLEPLRKGVSIDGERFQPMTVSIEREQRGNIWLAIGLKEGKNREIRRALEHVGLQVNRLIRVSYGPFQLGDLPTGGVEEIKAKTLRDQLGAKLMEGLKTEAPNGPVRKTQAGGARPGGGARAAPRKPQGGRPPRRQR